MNTVNLIKIYYSIQNKLNSQIIPQISHQIPSVSEHIVYNRKGQIVYESGY